MITRTRSVVAALAIATALGAPAAAQPFFDEWGAANDYFIGLSQLACDGQAALEGVLIDFAAVQQDPVAWNYLGMLRVQQMRGRCDIHAVEPSNATVIEALRQSAELGFPIGMHNYANALLEGQFGVELDVPAAIGWLEAALAGGYAPSGGTLAAIYTDGLYGQPQDLFRALDLLDEAVDLGLGVQMAGRIADRIDEHAAELNRQRPLAPVKPGPSDPGYR